MLKVKNDEKIDRKNYLQIKRDLNRTYPNSKYFSEGGQGQKSMENVLIAFSKYDTQVGYVQGMNFLAGALVYHCSEEIAFWVFVSLIEDYEIREVYLPGLPGLYMHTYIIDTLISLKISDIFRHLVLFL